MDGDPINLEDEVFQQIQRAAEGLQYIELRDLNAIDLDGDTSTPDHTTANSGDPDVIQVHLAEQERAFSSSEDNVVHLIVSSPEGGDIGYHLPEYDDAHMTVGPSGDSPSRIVYHETTADTSCVVHVDRAATVQAYSREVHDDTTVSVDADNRLSKCSKSGTL